MNEPNENVIAPNPKAVLTDVEVADVLRVSVTKIRRGRYAVPPRGPRFFRVDRSVRYTMADVLDFIRTTTVGTKQQPLAPEPTPTPPKRFNRTRKQSGGRRAA